MFNPPPVGALLPTMVVWRISAELLPSTEAPAPAAARLPLMMLLYKNGKNYLLYQYRLHWQHFR